MYVFRSPNVMSEDEQECPSPKRGNDSAVTVRPTSSLTRVRVEETNLDQPGQTQCHRNTSKKSSEGLSELSQVDVEDSPLKKTLAQARVANQPSDYDTKLKHVRPTTQTASDTADVNARTMYTSPGSHVSRPQNTLARTTVVSLVLFAQLFGSLLLTI